MPYPERMPALGLRYCPRCATRVNVLHMNVLKGECECLRCAQRFAWSSAPEAPAAVAKPRPRQVAKPRWIDTKPAAGGLTLEDRPPFFRTRPARLIAGILTGLLGFMISSRLGIVDAVFSAIAAVLLAGLYLRRHRLSVSVLAGQVTGPGAGEPVSIPAAEIEQLYTAPNPAQAGSAVAADAVGAAVAVGLMAAFGGAYVGPRGEPPRFHLWALLKDGRRLCLAGGFSQAREALFMEQEIERALGIADSPIEGEI